MSKIWATLGAIALGTAAALCVAGIVDGWANDRPTFATQLDAAAFAFVSIGCGFCVCIAAIKDNA